MIKHDLILIEPTSDYMEQICQYRREFLENGESMDGTSLLWEYENIEEWLEFVRISKNKETCSPDWVPDRQYLSVRKSDNQLIGMIDIRDELNEECLNYYGHIGFSIRKSQRKRGYATEQLRLALERCANNSMERVLITCDKNNIASAKTIVKNGGLLENEIYDPNDGTMTQRYWVKMPLANTSKPVY